MCSNKTPELNLFQAFVDSSQDVLLLAQESALKLILLTSAVFRVIWPFQNYFSCYFAILFPNFFFQASARALFLHISAICQGSSNLISRFSELYRSSFLKFLHKNQLPSFLILLLSAICHCYFHLISRFFQLYFLGALSTPSCYSPACRLAKELWEHGSSWPMPTQKAKSHTMLQRNISRSPTTRSFTTLEQQPWRLQPDGADFQPRRASKSVETSWPCY